MARAKHGAGRRVFSYDDIVASTDATLKNLGVETQLNSLWMATTALAEEPPLPTDTNADVCIVGAGIAGLTTAYLLSKEGRRVVVLDDGPTAGGETCRTTAHLVSALDDRFYHLEELHGAEGARLAAQSHAAAIDRIERIVQDERIECDFTRLDGYLFVPPGRGRCPIGRGAEGRRSTTL
jgi:hypothetical protein